MSPLRPHSPPLYTRLWLTGLFDIFRASDPPQPRTFSACLNPPFLVAGLHRPEGVRAGRELGVQGQELLQLAFRGISARARGGKQARSEDKKSPRGP